MSDFQLNRVRELIESNDPNLFDQLKEVISKNPTEQLVKKWDKKLKDINKQEKTTVATLLENQYLAHKKYQDDFLSNNKNKKENKLNQLKLKLSKIDDDSITDVLEAQIEIMANQKDDFSTDIPYIWRYVNTSDEILKFWDTLKCKPLIDIQALTQTYGKLNYTLKDKNEEISIFAETHNTGTNTKVSGEAFANKIDNIVFAKLFQIAIKQCSTATVLCETIDEFITKMKDQVYKTPVNIITNNKFHTDHPSFIIDGINYITSELIENDFFVVVNATDKGLAPLFLTIYEPFVNNNNKDSYDSSFKLIEHPNSDNVCKAFKIPQKSKLVKEMLDNAVSETKKFKHLYNAVAHRIEDPKYSDHNTKLKLDSIRYKEESRYNNKMLDEEMKEWHASPKGETKSPVPESVYLGAWHDHKGNPLDTGITYPKGVSRTPPPQIELDRQRQLREDIRTLEKETNSYVGTNDPIPKTKDNSIGITDKLIEKTDAFIKSKEKELEMIQPI